MKRIAAFKYAIQGMWTFFSRETNGQLQLVAAIIAIALGFWLHISTGEWLTILLCVGAVLSLEMMNTALEKLCDMVHADFHPQIKIIKDVAAGAVLLSAVVSLIIGIIIFLPKICSQF